MNNKIIDTWDGRPPLTVSDMIAWRDVSELADYWSRQRDQTVTILRTDHLVVIYTSTMNRIIVAWDNDRLPGLISLR